VSGDTSTTHYSHHLQETLLLGQVGFSLHHHVQSSIWGYREGFMICTVALLLGKILEHETYYYFHLVNY
jgi:hypothetical protein